MSARSASVPSSASTVSPSAAPSARPAPSPPREPSRIDLPRIGLFLLIAVAASTLLSLPFGLGLLPAETVGLIVPLAQLSPLLAALIVRRRGRPWWRDLALAVPSWRLLGIAVIVGALAFAAAPLLKNLLGLALGAPLGTTPLLPLLLAIPAVLVMQTVFAIGEEAGWRGWLHDQLAPLGLWRMSLLTGVLWSLWHLPVVIALGLQGREAVTYLLTIVMVAPLLAIMREISGTAWAAVIGHGLFNSLRVAIDQNLLGPVDPGLAWLIDGLGTVCWIVVAVLAWTSTRQLRPARPAPAVAPVGPDA
ncbi:MAG TPA: CPBP family intramembrane metalloprotease [Candidatus Brachybacterium merdigallinarum]|nr:CPBP family intramembrane metalloprotease [Candidatus Brachybacterium merdigallinarum]